MNKKSFLLSVIIFIIVLFASLFFALFVYLGLLDEFGSPYYKGGGSDDFLYELYAKEFKNEFGWFDKEHVRQVLASPFHNSTGFVWFLANFVGFIENFFSYHTMHFRVLNCFLLSITSVIYFLLIDKLQLFSYRESFFIATVSFCLPFVMYINSFVFRDTLVLFLMMAYLFALLSAHKELLRKGFSHNFYVYSAIVMIACLLMYPLRVQYSALFFVLYSFFVFYSFKKYLNRKTAFLFLVSIIVIFLVLFYYSGIFEQVIRLVYLYQDYVSGSSQGFTSFIFNQPLPITALLRIVFSPFYPIPEIDFNYKLLIFFNIILQVCFFPIIVLGFVKMAKSQVARPVVVFFLLIYLGVVWGTYTFRHFFYIAPFYPLFCYYGYKHIKGFHIYLIALIFVIAVVVSLLLFRFV